MVEKMAQKKVDTSGQKLAASKVENLVEAKAVVMEGNSVGWLVGT